jgi:hypothetical protein
LYKGKPNKKRKLSSRNKGNSRLWMESGLSPLFWCIPSKKKGIISSTLSDRFLNTILPGGAFPRYCRAYEGQAYE